MSAIDDLIARDAGASAPAGVDAIIARDAGPQAAAPAAPAAPTAQPAQQPSSPLALDLAAGGASPDTWNQLQQVGSGAAHGIGSMFNNAANFVERHLPFFPADIAARDTAIQAASDQNFAKNASPGAQAAGAVAPLIMPMAGAMRAGNAVNTGIRALPAMGGMTGRVIGSVASNATNGAVMSTGAPIDPNQPTGQQDANHLEIGAGLGVGIPGIFGTARALGSSVYNAVRPILNPRDYVGQQFSAAVGDEAQNVAANIRNAPQFVPGSMPTTAQVSANPMVVQTEKAARNANPDFQTAFQERANQNNAARWNALNQVAQTPEALTAAQTARSDAAGPLYDAAHSATTNVGPAFMRYARIPEMQEAMRRADALASLNSATGRGVAPLWPQAPTPGVAGSGSRAINGAALDYTSRALGDMIGEASNQPSRAGALRALQQRVDSWTQSYIPGVQQADAAYAAGSVPINTMEVGQQIANNLGTRAMNSSNIPEIQMMPYRSALTNAMNNGNAAKYGIEANALGNLQGIGQDLQRATTSNSIRSPGSDTAYNVAANGWLARNLYGNNFGGATGVGRAIGALGAAATGHPMVGLGILGGGNRIGQIVGNRLNAHLSDLLMNPESVLPYLDAQSAMPGSATRQALATGLNRYVLPAAIGGISRSGLVNAN